MKSNILKLLVAFLAFGLLTFSPVQAQNIDDIIRAAVDNPARAERNRSRDELRKPMDVIKFMGVEPGMTILDMYADGSYYTEILADIVGDDGRVIAHLFPQAGMNPDNPTTTYIRTSAHLKNVVPIFADINDLDLAEDSIDQVFIIQFYHDFYYKPLNVNLDRILSVYKKMLKPGGIVAIVDHEAIKGAPSSVGDTLHRIDPEIVINDMTNAGFSYEGKLDILLNDTDDKSISVFDESVRGKTSRFILKFRNPE